ncbi:MAG TPA: AEC family transporter [Anaerolineales bacterium]|nr:AEC family transporter [Anaerolineales bacterium]
MSFSVLASTFANNILPIVLLSGAGFALGKLLQIDPRSLGRVAFYIFSPILIFDLLVQNQLKLTEVAVVVAFAVCFILTVGVLTLLVGILLKLERPVLVSTLIVTMFANTGNYGLPLVSFAFGEQALSYAGIYFVTMTLLFYTFGVFLASLGHMSVREAALGLLRIPTVYAVLFAILINMWHITLPVPVARAVQLAADGTIPLLLILLGVQLTQVQFSGNQRAMQLSVSFRLLLAPLVALLFAALFGLQGFSRQASVTEASMPTMVSTTVLATEYNLDFKLVTAVVFISTLLSPLTLTPLLVFLGR